MTIMELFHIKPTADIIVYPVHCQAELTFTTKPSVEHQSEVGSLSKTSKSIGNYHTNTSEPYDVNTGRHSVHPLGFFRLHCWIELENGKTSKGNIKIATKVYVVHDLGKIIMYAIQSKHRNPWD